MPRHSRAEQLIVSNSVLSDWRKLLLYQPKIFGGYKSIVDDSSYFLSKEGQSNEQAELRANLEELEKNPALFACRFPARVIFFEKNFGKNIPRDHCKEFLEWQKSIPAQKLSLVFSSFYAQSAATLFGHSLIRIHLEPGKTSGVLDLGLNYAAELDTDNPIVYGFKGIFGYFKGKLSILPYAIKIQEYNYAESRDIWEYELNFTQEEIQLFLAVAWEVGHSHIHYYYLDENCSYILLLLLDASKPELNLARKIKSWSIPSDTIRIVHLEKDLVKGVYFRPSNFKVLQARLNALEANEKKIFLEWIQTPNLSTLNEGQLNELIHSSKISQTAVIKLIDAWVDWIDFQEKLAGSAEPIRYKELRFLLLKKRSLLPVQNNQFTFTYENDPQNAWGPNQIGLGVLSYSEILRQNFASPNTTRNISPVLRWRPALNDLKAASVGTPRTLEVRLMEIDFQVRPSRIYEWTFFSLENGAPFEIAFRNFSNRFSIAYRRPWYLGSELQSQFELNVGYGISQEFQFIHSSLYLEPILALPFNSSAYVGLKLPMRAIIEWPVKQKHLKSSISFIPVRILNGTQKEIFWELEHTISYRPDFFFKDVELRATQKVNQNQEVLNQLDLSYYY